MSRAIRFAMPPWYASVAMAHGATREPAMPATANADCTIDDARRRRFEAIFDAHHDAVWRTLRRLGVRDAQVDDATQHVFLVAARKLETIRAGEEGPFLYGVALRVASETRRRDPALRQVQDEGAFESISDDAPGPEDQLIAHEARTALDEVLARLPDDLREVLVLVELEGLSVPDVAEVLRIPTGTAASRLRRARESFTECARRVRARMSGGRR